MPRFQPDEIAPIHAAVMAYPAGEARQAALMRACQLAQEVDERLAKGLVLELHPEANALTKAVIGAVEAMAKREKGAPLSEAELEQRREAARKKGDVSVTGAAAAAAAGAAGGIAASNTKKAGVAYILHQLEQKGGRVGRRFTGKKMVELETGKGFSPARQKLANTMRHLVGATRPDQVSARKAGNVLAALAPSRRSMKVGAGLALASYAANKYNANRAEKAAADDLQKAIEVLPLAKRAVADSLYREGRDEELRKFLGPALMAARAALPSIARGAAAAAGFAGRATSGVMAAGKKAWGGARAAAGSGFGRAALGAASAADGISSGAKAAGNWARSSGKKMAASPVARGVGLGVAGGAAAGGAMYGAGALGERRRNNARMSRGEY